MIVLIGLIITLKYIRPMIQLTGFTVFKSTGLKVDYPLVDLDNKVVTGVVSFKNKKCMTVIVNFQSDTVKVEGNIENIRKEQCGSDYIDMIKNEAKFFVENKISNPKKYYEQLIEDNPS
jgi:hypothetical protein